MSLTILPGIVNLTKDGSITASSEATPPFIEGDQPNNFTKVLGDKLSEFTQKLADKKADNGKVSLDKSLETNTDGLEETDLTALLSALNDTATTIDNKLTASQLADSLKENFITPSDKTVSDATQTLQALLAMLPHQITATLAQKNGNNVEGDAVTDALNLSSSQKGVLTQLTQNNQFSSTDDLGNTPKAKNQAGQEGYALLNSGTSTNGNTTELTALTQRTGNVTSENTSPQPVTINAALSSLTSLVSTTANGGLNTASLTTQLNAQLGSPEWQQTLGQQVLLFSRNGQQTAELCLHPQELGSLKISLKVEDNLAQLHFTSAHSQVRAVLEAAIPSLRNALAEGGIQLGQSSVSSDSSSQSQQAQQQNTGGHDSEAVSANEIAQVPLTTPAALQSLAADRNGIDIFA